MSASADAAAKARHLLAVRRWAEARNVLAKALASEPDCAQLHALMAQALIDGGPSGESAARALHHATRACALEPESAWHHRLRALAHERADEPLESFRAAQEAVRLGPLDWSNHAILAQSAMRVRRGAPVAHAAAARAVDLAPNTAEAHFALGLVAQWTGRRRTARAAYRRVLQIDPQHSAAHNNLGTLAGLRLWRAAEQYLRAARADPHDAAAVANLRAHPKRLWVVLLLMCVSGSVLGSALNSAGHMGFAKMVGLAIPVLWGTLAAVAIRVWPPTLRADLLAQSMWVKPAYAGTLGALALLGTTEALCFVPALGHAVLGSDFSFVAPGVFGGLVARWLTRKRRRRLVPPR